MSTFCECTNSADVSWCKKWILALAIVQTLSMGKSFLFMTGKGDGDAAMLFNIVTVIAVILFLILAIYVNYKNKVWHFLFRLLLSVMGNVILLVMAAYSIGVAAAIVWVVAAVLVNRRRFAVFLRYKNYISYIVATYILTAGLRLAVMRLFFHKPEMWPLIQLGSFAISMALLGWFYHLLMQEIQKGRTFFEATRIVALIPVAFIYFLIGLLTIVPVKFFSGESLFGEEGNDYLVMPQK